MSMDYPGNELNALADGCVMDLRMRLAIQFIVGGAMPGNSPDEKAIFALDMAESLVSASFIRGYIAPVPEGTELSSVVKNQVKRNAAAQAIAQSHGAKVAMDLAGPLAPMGRPIGMHG